MKKTNLCLAVTAALAVGGSLAATQAMAHEKHAKKHHHEVTSYSVSSSTSTHVTDHSKVDALEAQVQAMQYELQALRAEANRPRSTVDTAKVQELDQWMNTVKAKHGAHHEKDKDNMIFFRGGYLRQDDNRGGTLDPTNLGSLFNSNGLTTGVIGNQSAWYFGAGFDFHLNDDLFGLMQNTDLLAELMFDYKELGKGASNGLSPQETAVLKTLGVSLPAANTKAATVNQFTLAASPKVKFFKGQAFRPWLIPVGFEVNVVSPPSNAITVLNPGFQSGIGADYKIWNNLYVGADARYHYSTGTIDGINTNGITAGGYVGIGF